MLPWGAVEPGHYLNDGDSIGSNRINGLRRRGRKRDRKREDKRLYAETWSDTIS